jgi:hypothetical protein
MIKRSAYLSNTKTIGANFLPNTERYMECGTADIRGIDENTGIKILIINVKKLVSNKAQMHTLIGNIRANNMIVVDIYCLFDSFQNLCSIKCGITRGKDTINLTASAFSTNNLETASMIEPQDQVIAAMVKQIKSNHIRRLRDGLCTVEYGISLEDLLNSYNRSAAHCSNVAVEMLQLAEGKLEAHEYLGELKAGHLEESTKYNEHYNYYRGKYAIPEHK